MARASVESATRATTPISLPAASRGSGRESVLRAAAFFGVPVLLVVATVLVDLLFLPAPYPSDQINYLQAARDFPSVPENAAVVHQYMRIGLVMPMALAIKLVGYSQAAYYVVPVIAGVALALAVYALGSMLFGRTLGVAATVLTLGSTPIFSELATPLPDVLATALFCCAVALAVALRMDTAAAVRSGRGRIAALLAIGVLLGWSYLSREYIVFGWPIVALVLFRPAQWRDLFWVGLPLVVIGIGEMALNSYLYGDPLARLHVAAAHGSGPVPEEIAASYQHKPRSWYLGLLVADLARTPEGPWLVAALGVTVLGAIVWPRRVGLFLAWALAFYVPLVLLGGVLNPAQPSLRLTVIRYWLPIFPAFLVGGAATVSLAVRGLAHARLASRHSWVAAGALTVAVATVPTAVAQAARSHDPAYRINGATQLEQFRSWLAANGGSVATLWAAPRTAYLAEMFTSGPFGGRVWNGAVRPLTAPPGVEPRPGDEVILYSAYSSLCGHCRLDAQQVFGNPVTVPPSWEVIFNTPDEVLRIYVVR